MKTWMCLHLWQWSRRVASHLLLDQIQDAFNEHQDGHARRMSLVLSDYQRIERDVVEYLTGEATYENTITLH